MSLYRLSTGLILKEDWSTPTGWTSTSASFSVSGSPGFCCFGRLPIDAVAPTVGGLDAGGCREALAYYEGGTTYLFYNGGDGTAASTGDWRPQAQFSTNGGITWSKTGYVLGSAGLASGGSEGAIVYRDMGFYAKWGSTYVIYPLYGYNTLTPPNGKGRIPYPPYTCDSWTSSSPLGPWSYVSATPAPGPGAFDQGAAQTSCVVLEGTTLWDFYTSSHAGYGSYLNVGLASSPLTSPAGPWTKYPADAGAPILEPIAANQWQIENPRVWFWPALNCYAMTVNGRSQATPGGSTPVNLYYLSSSLKTWSTTITGPFVFQHVSGASKDQVVIDGFNNVGVISPVYTAGGLPIVDQNGYMPATFDYGGDELWSNVLGDEHVGRSVAWTVLEPSPSCLLYAYPGGTDTAKLYRKDVSYADFIAEWEMDYSNQNNTGFVGLGVDYRIQASGDSYRYLLPTGGGLIALQLWKSTGGSAGVPGTYSNIATAFVGAGTSTNMNGATFTQLRCKLVVTGNTHTFYLDGEKQIVYNDSSSPYTSGTSVGFFAGGCIATFRLFHMRTSDTVTVQNVQSGEGIFFRAPGGPPVEVSLTSGESYSTTSIHHYPVDTIEYGGIGYSFATQGLIWGGDVLSFADPAGGLTQPSTMWRGLLQRH